MKPGDRIKWKYTHHIFRSEVTKVKYGEYIGLIRHTSKYKSRHPLAMVQFDGNKNVSKVPHCELEYVRMAGEKK